MNAILSDIQKVTDTLGESILKRIIYSALVDRKWDIADTAIKLDMSSARLVMMMEKLDIKDSYEGQLFLCQNCSMPYTTNETDKDGVCIWCSVYTKMCNVISNSISEHVKSN